MPESKPESFNEGEKKPYEVTEKDLVSEEGEKSLEEIYRDPNYVTLFRYEKPTESYDDRREGVVSKQEILGQWFTDNLDHLRSMMLKKEPNGKIIVVRVLKSQLSNFEASKNENTKDMDIDPDDHIIPPEIQSKSRLEIPVDIETSGVKNFLLKDRGKINDFFEKNLAESNLIELAKNR